MHRLYEQEDIAVFWDSDKCFHSKRCVTGSPKTFDPARRPWIDLSYAPAPEIWKAVNNCPSGALSCVYTHGIRVVLESDKTRSAAYDGDTKIGECDYRITPEGWEIFHTEVSENYGGKGIAKRLVYKVTEAAEQSKSRVIPICSYAVKVLAGQGRET